MAKNKYKEMIKIKSDISDLIRLGPKWDSGYVASRAGLEKSDCLYTYGVGSEEESDFEMDYAKMYPEKYVKMYDHTISYFEPKEKNIELVLEGLFYSKESNKTTFEEHVIKNKDADKNIFLKIDAEGAEWDFLNNINFNNNNIIGMILEFHCIDHPAFFPILEKILEVYDIIHIHGNTGYPLMQIENGLFLPHLIEISFLRKDINPQKESVSRQFPLNGLDYPNNKTLKTDHSFFIGK
jgi:hypothetical protein